MFLFIVVIAQRMLLEQVRSRKISKTFTMTSAAEKISLALFCLSIEHFLSIVASYLTYELDFMRHLFLQKASSHYLQQTTAYTVYNLPAVWCTAQGTNRSIRPVGVLSTAGSSIHIIMKSRTMFRVRSRSTILTTSTSPQSSVMHLMCGLLHRRSVLHNGFVLVVQCLLVRYYTDYLSVFNHTLIKSHCLID